MFLSLTQSYQLKALALISTQKKTSHPNLIFYMPESKAKSKKPEYSRGYINLSEALSKPFFKNDEAAIFTPDTIQRNDRKGLLEINYYETLYNNELSVVYDSKGKSEEFYFFFCSQFFDSKLFKSFKKAIS